MADTLTATLPFTYEEYSEWFDYHSEKFLQPALEEATNALNALLEVELNEPQRVRIRVGVGRVKSKTRTWKKINDKYAGEISSVADIPAVVDDLVGLRVVCTNKSDVDSLVEVLEGLEKYSDGDNPVLATDPGSNKDWRADPKDSGYRAYHLNLCTSVPHVTDRRPVICEMQIRTLLQDSWGELTHEDTYKPGAEVPPLVDTLSRRMADLMATLDDIAEDLRTELDRLAEDSIDSDSEEESTEASVQGTNGLPRAPELDTGENPTRKAAEAYLSERVAALDRPIPLPTLAWEVQREFGREISNGWLGYGSFKKMLASVVPEARVSPGPSAYVLPAGFDISSYDPDRPGVPRAISLLKDSDRSFPLIDSEHWPRIYAALADATHNLRWEGSPDIRNLNELTRVARDAAENTADEHISRGQLKYVAWALTITHHLRMNMSPRDIEDIFVDWMLARSTGMNLPQEDSDQIESWLRGKGI
jgi:ppGpp synthetase/RelA/SpoT-type nucleotidyltranferase